MQSVKTPSIKDSVRSILNNKPVLLMTLSDFLAGFGISGSKSDYYIDVLHFASMTMLAGIPAAPLSPISFSFVPWFRRRFSSRFLYIVSNEIGSILYVFVFLFGCIGFNPKTFKGGLYRKKLPMFFAMALWELIWTLFYGLMSVIGTELSDWLFCFVFFSALNANFCCWLSLFHAFFCMFAMPFSPFFASMPLFCKWLNTFEPFAASL